MVETTTKQNEHLAYLIGVNTRNAKGKKTQQRFVNEIIELNCCKVPKLQPNT